VFAIATSDHVVDVLMPDVLSRLCEEAPSSQLHLYSVPDNIENWLMRHGDVIVSRSFPDSANILQKLLFEDKFCCVGAKKYFPEDYLTRERFLASRHVLVSPFGGTDTVIDRILSESSTRRNIHAVLSNFSYLRWVLPSDEYLATVPLNYARLLGPDFSMFEVPYNMPPIKLFMLWHCHKQHNKKNVWLRELLVQAVASSQRKATI
jgi:DNA-binding transcriptional LysR family regulator